MGKLTPDNIVDPMAGQALRLRRSVTLQVCYQAGNGPPLVFLHGGLGNRYNWRSQYEYFLTQNRTVLTYDLAGHGQSSDYQRYSIGRHCRDLTRLLRRLHIHKPVLCCHSYGVPIGLEWAQRHPTSGLVLIAGGTHDLAPWWEFPLIKGLAWGGRKLFHWSPLQQLVNQLSSEHRGKKIDRFLAESPVPKRRAPYKALEIFWNYNFFRRRKNRRLQTIPILVMSGGQDPMFTETMGAELAAQFKQGQHRHWLQGGHLLIAEYASEVNDAIAQFVNSCQ